MPIRRRPHHLFSLEQYLEFELDHVEKFEYVDGAIVLMAASSTRHNLVTANTTVALHSCFAGRCRVLGSDQRVATADGLHTYPDALVVCATMLLTTYKGTGTLHNPSLLVEVLSPSTRDYDLGEKLERYQTIPTLRDVLLIDLRLPDVRHVRRTAQGWETRRFLALSDTIDLAEVTLPLATIYADVPEDLD
ncbi:MAG: Uma2 family endonuclease [Myxococcota bacterium]